MRNDFSLLSVIIAFVLLSGCASGPSKGGIHTVQGICKSCKPYFVRGAWYYPQKYYDYDEVGIASWYGPGFHGKSKPYGEIFDQNAISAAHTTLPLPTVVQVTNLENNSSLKIVVDDRGPYTYNGRIIDLSVGAAKELGVYNKGTAKVRVTSVIGESKALSLYLTRYRTKNGQLGRDPSGRTWVQIYNQEIKGKYPDESDNLPINSFSSSTDITPKSFQKTSTPTKDLGKLFEAAHKRPVSSVSKKTLSRQQYYVQVGGHFIQYKNANKLLNNLESIGPSGIKETIQASGQKLYSVFLGPYPDKAIANKTLAKLATTGHSDATIVKN